MCGDQYGICPPESRPLLRQAFLKQQAVCMDGRVCNQQAVCMDGCVCMLSDLYDIYINLNKPYTLCKQNTHFRITYIILGFKPNIFFMFRHI